MPGVDRRAQNWYAFVMHTNGFTETGDGARHTVLPSGRSLHIVKTDADRRAYEDGRDVLVLDDRDAGNPSFQILRSCAVRDPAARREILDAIIAFDLQYPSERPWRRSMDSLVKEWNLHNLAYRLHIYRKSSADVDLDNYDEGKGYFRFFVTSFERGVQLVWGKLKRLLQAAPRRG